VRSGSAAHGLTSTDIHVQLLPYILASSSWRAEVVSLPVDTELGLRQQEGRGSLTSCNGLMNGIGEGKVQESAFSRRRLNLRRTSRHRLQATSSSARTARAGTVGPDKGQHTHAPARPSTSAYLGAWQMSKATLRPNECAQPPNGDDAGMHSAMCIPDVMSTLLNLSLLP
jgi:hypothetical protein